MFISHDDIDKFYWIENYPLLLDKLGVFAYLLPLKLMLFLIFASIPIAIVNAAFPFSSLFIFAIFLIAGIIFFIHQEYRIKLTWKIIKPRLIEIASQLRE